MKLNNGGFSFTEVLVGLSITAIAALGAVELQRLSAILNRDITVKNSEQDIIRQANNFVSDKDACTEQLKDTTIQNADSNSGFSDDVEFKRDEKILKEGQVEDTAITISKLKLESVSSPIIDGMRSAKLKIKMTKAGKFLGAAESEYYIPIYINVDPNTNKVTDCGNIYSSESYCTSLRGRWDASTNECIYDERRSCWHAGGSYSNVAGTTKCTFCYAIGGTLDSSGKCKTPATGPVPDSNKFNGKIADKWQFDFNEEPEVEVTNFDCSYNYPQCSNLVGVICSPGTGGAVVCQSSEYTPSDYFNNGVVPKTCRLRQVECKKVDDDDDD